MELRIPNPDSFDFCEAVGISPERQQELSASLDAMVRREDSQPAHIGKMYEVWKEVASYCADEWELIYCVILHTNWQLRNKGRQLAPGPLNKEVIQMGLDLLYGLLRDDNSQESRNILMKLIVGDEAVIKEGAREGVQRLIDLKEGHWANDIINKLTGYAF